MSRSNLTPSFNLALGAISSILAFSFLALIFSHRQFAKTPSTPAEEHQNTDIRHGPGGKTKSQLEISEKKSNEAFHAMMDVLTHPRCVNCHPNDGIPKQTLNGRPHHFNIAGGVNQDGFESLKCAACHQSSNNLYSGVPGEQDWALAPPSMAWEGLNRFEIARSMMNPANNGNRSPEEIRHHLTEHSLVLWAWEPGIDAHGIPRETPPVPLQEYIDAVSLWIEAGAIIPDENSIASHQSKRP